MSDSSFDLTDFLKEGSVADLEWLNVDEEMYRKNDTLPKQNLNTVPDLEAFWDHSDNPSSAYFVHNTGAIPLSELGGPNPDTMGDMSEAHGPLKKEIEKAARVAMMLNPDLDFIKSRLLSQFSKEELRGARTVLASALEERGLLGFFYLNASDFENVTQHKKDLDFIRKASKAKYCLHPKDTCGACFDVRTAKGEVCGKFQRQIKVAEVPYTDSDARHVEALQRGLGKKIASKGTARDRIKAALLAPAPTKGISTYEGEGVSHYRPASMSRQEIEQGLKSASIAQKQASVEVFNREVVVPIKQYILKESLKGASVQDIDSSMRLHFAKEDIEASKQQWSPFMSKSGKDLMLKQAPQLLTGSMVKEIADYRVRLGRMAKTAASQLPSDPMQALRHIRSNAISMDDNIETNIFLPQQFTGTETAAYETPLHVVANIVKKANTLMKSGLFGYELVDELNRNFIAEDITAAKSELRKIIKAYEQSLPEDERIKLASKIQRPATKKLEVKASMVESMQIQDNLRDQIEFTEPSSDFVVELGQNNFR